MLRVRQYRSSDAPIVWALNDIPHHGPTADSSVPLPLVPVHRPPREFPDLAHIEYAFIEAGGDFLVAELDGHLVGMGGFRANDNGQAQVLRVRVHPAVRRRGVGAQVMAALEQRAGELGFREAFLDTSTHQPEAMAFYESRGYLELGRETRPGWSWTLVFYTKTLG